MQLPSAVRRVIYRVGYRVLQLSWVLTGPRTQGVKCVITNADKVLLVRHSYGRRWWDLPGGSMKRGELALQTAQREMAEELGIHGAEWEPVGEITIRFSGKQDTLHCVRAELAAPALQIDRGELLTARWFARAQLPYNMNPYVIPIIARTTVKHIK